MIDAPLALAFTAGLVATVNPCGFAMLPAYLGYFMGDADEAETRTAAMRRALVVGGVVSSGFMVVFGVTGVLIAAGTAGFQNVITTAIPYVALVVGALVAILGVAMLLGFELTVGLPKAKGARRGRGLGSVFAFGTSYAIASLSCTLPVFLSVVALQMQRTDFVSGAATFLAYGLGMSMLLLGVTVAIGLGRQALVARLRRSVGYVKNIAGALLVLAGGYIMWFWATNLLSGATALSASGPFRLVESLSAWALDVIGENALLWGLALGVAVGAAILYVVLRSDSDVEPDRELVDAAHGRGR